MFRLKFDSLLSKWKTASRKTKSSTIISVVIMSFLFANILFNDSFVLEVRAVVIKQDNSVDADSDIDSVSNIGNNDSSYLNSQSLDGTDQVIQESNTGEEEEEGQSFISIYDSNSARADSVSSLIVTVDSGGDNAMAIIAVGYLDDNSETATCTFDSVAMTELITAEFGGDDSRVYIWYLKNPNTGTSLDFEITFSAQLIWEVEAWGAVLNNVDLVDTFGDSEVFEGDPTGDVEFVLDAIVDDFCIAVIHTETLADTWESIGDGSNVIETLFTAGNALSILTGNSTGSTFTVTWTTVPTLDHTASASAIIHSAGEASSDVSKYPSSIANAYDPSDIGEYSDWTKMQSVDSDENNLTETQAGGDIDYPVLESWSTTEGLAQPSVTVTKPSGTVENDLLIMAVTIDGIGAPISITAGGATWNVMLAEVQTAGHTTATFYKIAGGSEPASYTATWSGNEDSVGGVLRFTSFDTGDPFDVSATNTGTSSPITFPAITTTNDNTFILRMAGMDDDEDLEPILGVPSPHTELWALATTSSSGECTQLAMNTSKGTAGEVVSADWSHDSGEDWYSLSIAINGFVGVGSGDYLFDREFRFTSVSTDTFTNVELDIKTGTLTNETLIVHIYDSGSWVFVANLTDSDDDTWINTSVIDYFSTTMYFRFNSSIYDGSDTYLNHWEIDAVVLHYWNTSTLYRLEWEHQVSEVDTTDKDSYNVTIYGFYSDNGTSNHPSNAKWFEYYKSFTIDNIKVEGSGSHTNFTMLVNLFDSDLKTKVQSDGDDIRFGSITTWYSHEVELFNQAYNSSHALLVAWVRIPSLSTSLDTIINMYYGNTTMSAQETPEDVWDSNYAGVYHLSEDPTGTIYDSTSNSLDGDSEVTMESGDQILGLIDGSLDFSTDDFINLTDNDLWTFNTAGQDTVLSFGAWIKFDTTGSQNILTKYDTTTNGEWSFNLDASDKLTIVFTDSDNGAYIGRKYNTPLTVNNWQFIYVTYDGTEVEGGIDLYVNGSVVDDTAYSFGSYDGMNNDAVGAIIGASNTGTSGNFEGIIDEVRIQSFSRTANWILTEWNNQFTPSNFYSVDVESTVLEQINIQLWNQTSSAWINTSYYIKQVEKWYNFTIDNYSGVIGTTVTWRYIDTLINNDLLKNTLNIDYAGITYWNYSIDLIETTWSLGDYDATINGWQDIPENPFNISVASLFDFKIEIQGVDVSGSPISNNYVRVSNTSDFNNGFNLTTSYQTLFSDQSSSTTDVQFWMFVAFPKLGGSEGSTFTWTVNVRISRS